MTRARIAAIQMVSGPEVAANLAAAVGLRPEDAWINLVEVAKENWSFGNGVASYAPAEAQSA